MTDVAPPAPAPAAWQAAYVSACAGATFFCLAYGAVDYLHVPHFFHYQVEHVFRLEARAAGPAPSGYPGLWLWALLAGLAAAAIAYAIVRVRRRAVSTTSLTLWLAWTLTSFAFVAAYFTWNLWPASGAHG